MFVYWIKNAYEIIYKNAIDHKWYIDAEVYKVIYYMILYCTLNW